MASGHPRHFCEALRTRRRPESTEETDITVVPQVNRSGASFGSDILRLLLPPRCRINFWGDGRRGGSLRPSSGVFWSSECGEAPQHKVRSFPLQWAPTDRDQPTRPLCSPKLSTTRGRFAGEQRKTLICSEKQNEEIYRIACSVHDTQTYREQRYTTGSRVPRFRRRKEACASSASTPCLPCRARRLTSCSLAGEPPPIEPTPPAHIDHNASLSWPRVPPDPAPSIPHSFLLPFHLSIPRNAIRATNLATLHPLSLLCSPRHRIGLKLLLCSILGALSISLLRSSPSKTGEDHWLSIPAPPIVSPAKHSQTGRGGHSKGEREKKKKKGRPARKEVLSAKAEEAETSSEATTSTPPPPKKALAVKTAHHCRRSRAGGILAPTLDLCTSSRPDSTRLDSPGFLTLDRQNTLHCLLNQRNRRAADPVFL